MSNTTAINHIFNNPWNRLAIATTLALVILLVIIFLAINFSEHDSVTNKKIVFEGYLYLSEGDSSLEEFLDEKRNRTITSAVRKNFVTAMHGEHWLWFSPKGVSNTLEILLIDLAWLDHVTIYFLSKAGEYETYEAGDEYPFSQRIIDFRKPAFPLLREINQQEVETIALRISAQGRFSMPLFALSEKAFNAQVNLDYLFYGAWIAILVALGFYNATIFFSLRYNIHLYYIIYLLVFTGLLIVASGIGQQYIWPNSKSTTTLLANVSLALTNYGTAFFVIRFVRLSDYNRTLTSVLKWLSYISLLCIPLVFVFSYDALTPILLCSFIIMTLILPAAVYATLKGNEIAPFLFASLVVLLPCNTVGLIRFMGYFENLHWTEHLAELGLVADAVILSLALAYKVDLLRGEKENVTIARENERIEFAKQLFHAKEEERKMIGKALHDDLGHRVLSIRNSVKSIPQGDDSRFKSKTLEMLDETLEEVRNLSHLLYPSIIEHIGIEKAISSVVSKGLYAKGIEHTVETTVLTVSNELELLLYRAAQELVNNVLKHSNASVFDLKVEKRNGTDEIILTATDNGNASFSERDFGFGLNMLKQQASLFEGELRIQRTSNGLNVSTLRIFDKKQ